MRCAACSKEVENTGVRFCDHCGAALYPSAPMPIADPSDPIEAPERPAWRPPRPMWAVVAVLAILALALLGWRLVPPRTSADDLHAAMQATLAQGDGPGQDPICVANGLAYDTLPVYVQADNVATIAWMDVLVTAGLYEAPEDGLSGGYFSLPILIYAPRPALAQWTGPKRLCIAKGMQPEAVENLGETGWMRFRGKRYTGVTADVQWGLQVPAPWLAAPGVADAFIQELPAWRGARWHSGPDGWRLTQRKHFFLADARWVTGEMLERQEAQASDAKAPSL